jgi:hypothetical protein
MWFLCRLADNVPIIIVGSLILLLALACGACVERRLPGGGDRGECGTIGERCRVHISENNIVLSDKNTPLRGATMTIVGETTFAVKADYWKHLHDIGLNSVRLGVKLSDIANKTLDQQLPLLDKAVDLAGRNHMYVIVMNSVHPGSYNLAELKAFWSVVADRYKNRTHVLYEMVNEPVTWTADKYTDQNISDLENVYDIMRSNAPDTHIILFDFASLQDGEIAAEKVATMHGVDYTKASVGFHYYGKTTKNAIETLKEHYPVLMTETNYWTNNTTIHIDAVPICEQLGIGWFSLDGKGSTSHLENEIIPNLHRLGYAPEVEN